MIQQKGLKESSYQFSVPEATSLRRAKVRLLHNPSFIRFLPVFLNENSSGPLYPTKFHDSFLQRCFHLATDQHPKSKGPHNCHMSEEKGQIIYLIGLWVENYVSNGSNFALLLVSNAIRIISASILFLTSST